jgi:hypothetical protein
VRLILRTVCSLICSKSAQRHWTHNTSGRWWYLTVVVVLGFCFSRNCVIFLFSFVHSFKTVLTAVFFCMHTWPVYDMERRTEYYDWRKPDYRISCFKRRGTCCNKTINTANTLCTPLWGFFMPLHAYCIVTRDSKCRTLPCEATAIWNKYSCQIVEIGGLNFLSK